jgi:anti-anti-sigma regulatory factor
MTRETTDAKHQLSGDWTIAGVVTQVELLSHCLENLDSAGKNGIYLDCGRIDSIDMSGLQLLHVWMGCVKIRGLQAKLVNLPDAMQQTIQHLGIGHCFMDTGSDASRQQ